MGCTDCGRKGGCDTRKHGMFAAVDDALARLYPTRRWNERNEVAALGQGISADEAAALADAIAARVGALALFRPGDPEEWCEYIYVLCLGRTPSIVEIRDRHADAPADAIDDGGADGIEERYLRVALSGLARFAGVQEVAMTLRRIGDDIVITERARGGVFDPVLLPRFQSLVAALAAAEIRHLDFGEIVEPPDGFDPADYPERYGGAPAIANYLFYPQSTTAVSTVVMTAPTSWP
jgi:hypothetical protein